jgi:hypothetical protein
MSPDELIQYPISTADLTWSRVRATPTTRRHHFMTANEKRSTLLDMSNEDAADFRQLAINDEDDNDDDDDNNDNRNRNKSKNECKY